MYQAQQTLNERLKIAPKQPLGVSPLSPKEGRSLISENLLKRTFGLTDLFTLIPTALFHCGVFAPTPELTTQVERLEF